MSNLATHTQALLTTRSKEVTFSLPGRNALIKGEAEYEVILVDATETPIERPSKNKENTTPERKVSQFRAHRQ